MIHLRRLANALSSAYYGWYVGAALFFVTFVGIGSRQGFGVFVKTWEDDLGASVSLISVAAAVGWFMNGLSQPLFGYLTDRFGGRPVLIGSMTVMGLGIIAMSLAANVYMIIVLYGFVISFASGGSAFATTGTIIARWFRHRRGMVISLVSSGGSIGGMLLVPFAAYLLLLTSWQTVWIVIGAMVLILGVPIVVAVVRSGPGAMDRERDPHSESTGDHLPQPEPEGPLSTDRWRDSLSSPPMWQLSMGYFVCGITTASISVHYVRWAESEAISIGTAALAFGLLSGINAASVLTIGWLSDRMRRKTLLGAVYFTRAVAFLSLIVLPPHIALWTFAVISGASWLATVPLTTSLAADVYGVRVMGTLSGIINMAHQLGGGIAVIAFGLIFSTFDTYQPAFIGGFLTLLFAGVISMSIAEERYSSRYVRQSRAVVVAPAESN